MYTVSGGMVTHKKTQGNKRVYPEYAPWDKFRTDQPSELLHFDAN